MGPNQESRSEPQREALAQARILAGSLVKAWPNDLEGALEALEGCLTVLQKINSAFWNEGGAK